MDGARNQHLMQANQQKQQMVNQAHFAQMTPHSMHQNTSFEHQQQHDSLHEAEYNMLPQQRPSSYMPLWNGPNATENIALHQQQQPSQHANGNSMAMTITAQIEAINVQQNKLREQLRTSEANLTAHRSVLMVQQGKQIEEVIQAAQNTQLEKLADENGISLKEFDAILQPIIESCTKESISSGKNWILQHSSDSARNNVVLQYLLKKALADGSTFQQKLHLIYLVNDILHHCARKNVRDLKNDLENVVIPMFCSADLIANSEQRIKLTRLLSLWESKAKFFDACVISKLQSPNSSISEYQTNLQNFHHEAVSKVTQATKATLDNYQQQHQAFVQYATQQITQLEQQKQQLEQQMLASVLPTAGAPVLPTPTLLQQQVQPQLQPQSQAQPHQKQCIINNAIPSLMSQKISKPIDDDEAELIQPPGVENNGYIAAQAAASNHSFCSDSYSGVGSGGGGGGGGGVGNNGYSNPQPNNFASDDIVGVNSSNFFIPDLSKPPPGFISGRVSGNVAQFPPISNMPSTSNAVNTNTGPTAATNISVELMTAIKIIHEQQQMQQQRLSLDRSPPLISREQEEELPQPPLVSYDTSKFANPNSTKYYDLPAGLMVPLIRLADCTYKPLDPEMVRLPEPTPQYERLTNAIAAFYTPPTHDRPRDSEGWEKLGLYEYYKVKNAAKKQKEEDIQNGIRERSRSPSPIILEKPKPKKKVNKRCYRSKSRSRSKSPNNERGERPRSRSRSPQTPRSRDGRSGRSGYNNRSNQRSRSPQRGGMGNQDNQDNRMDNRSSNSGGGGGGGGNGNNNALWVKQTTLFGI